MADTSPPQGLSAISPDEAVRRVSLARNAIIGEVQKVVVGNEDLIDQLLIALFSKGHVLLSGMPGEARGLAVSTLAQVVHLRLSQLMLTPDYTPADLSGRQAAEAGDGEAEARLIRGPLFANLVLAEDIDRAPPITQAALLHAMQTGQTTVAGRRFELQPPFMVIGVQNDVLRADSNPLTESQRDRFMLSARMGYPSEEQEREIVARNSQPPKEDVRVVLRARDVLWVQDLVRQIPAAQHIVDFAVDVARATRPGEPGGPEFVSSWVDWGASTRAAEQLVVAAKARALIRGRHVVHAGDVRAVAPAVLRHRVIMSRQAEIKGVGADQLVTKLVQVVKERSYGETPEPPELIVVSPLARPIPYAAAYSPMPPHVAEQLQAAQMASGDSYPPQPPSPD